MASASIKLLLHPVARNHHAIHSSRHQLSPQSRLWLPRSERSDGNPRCIESKWRDLHILLTGQRHKCAAAPSKHRWKRHRNRIALSERPYTGGAILLPTGMTRRRHSDQVFPVLLGTRPLCAKQATTQYRHSRRYCIAGQSPTRHRGPSEATFTSL